jgi:citrate synthase
MDSEEAARRLGVKQTTLYTYVSRGLIQSYPGARPGRSLFDAEDVEVLSRRARGGKQLESKLATIVTEITQLRPDGPVYRGQSAVDLATTSSFEQVAGLLWGIFGGDWRPLPLTPPTGFRDMDILRWIVVMAAAADPHRNDAHPELVTTRLRTLISTMSSLATTERPPKSVERSHDNSIAAQLADRLITARPRRSVIAALNAALVLLADHELAISTLSVRIAASTRATIYDAVLSGLGTLSGSLHIGTEVLACRLLYRAQSEGPIIPIDEALTTRTVIPGFSPSPVYLHRDPRAQALLEHVERIARPRHLQTIHAVLHAARQRQQPPPTVAFALAALVYATGMPPPATGTIFAVARVAGWGAHYLEELREPPVRYRARAHYAVVQTSTP